MSHLFPATRFSAFSIFRASTLAFAASCAVKTPSPILPALPSRVTSNPLIDDVSLWQRPEEITHSHPGHLQQSLIVTGQPVATIFFSLLSCLHFFSVAATRGDYPF